MLTGNEPEHRVYRTDLGRESFRPLELVQIIGCSKNLIYSMIASGQLKSIRCGNARKSIVVPRKCLEEFLDSASTGNQVEKGGAQK